jgi:DNA-binding CsgD family transcriptional regulator
MRIINKISFSDFVKYLFQILEETGIAAAIAGHDHSILSCNSLFPGIVSSKGKCSGMKLKQIFNKNQKDKYSKMLTALDETGYWSTETVFVKRRKVIHADLSFTEIKDINKNAFHILVIIKDISVFIEEENELKESIENLEKRNRELSDNISALKEIIIQTELEKRQIHNNLTDNILKVIIPVLDNLRKICGDDKNKVAYIDTIQKSLANINSSAADHYTSDYEKLTPREIEICNMIKKNISSKEAAGILNISILTVERHRHNIRKKLGLAKKKTNLHSYLNQE